MKTLPLSWSVPHLVLWPGGPSPSVPDSLPSAPPSYQRDLAASALWNNQHTMTRARNKGVPRAQGSLEFSCGSLEFLQGAKRCTSFYTQQLYVVYYDAIGLPGNKLNFEPYNHCCSHSHSQQGVWVSFGCPNPQNLPLWTPKSFFWIISQNLNFWGIYLKFFHLNMIPMTLLKDVMSYLDK